MGCLCFRLFSGLCIGICDFICFCGLACLDGGVSVVCNCRLLGLIMICLFDCLFSCLVIILFLGG